MLCRKGEDVLVKSTVVVAKIRVYLGLTRRVNLKIAYGVYMDRVIHFGQFAQRSALAAIVREDIEAIPFQDGQCNSFFEESAARLVERTIPPKGIPFGL